jgi:hypothetical protein
MRIRIADIRSRHYRQQQGHIVHRARHRADDAGERERAGARREVSRCRHASRRWLQAYDAGEVGRDADGSAAIAADATRRESGRYRRRLAAARAAGGAAGIPRVTGAPVQRVVGFPRHQVLGNVGDAEDDRACFACTTHQRRVTLTAYAAPQWAARFPRHPRDRDRALDAERHAVQRPERLAACDCPLRGSRSRPRAVCIDEHEGVQLGIERLDTFEVSVHDVHGRHFAPGDEAGDFMCGKGRDRRYRHSCPVYYWASGPRPTAHRLRPPPTATAYGHRLRPTAHVRARSPRPRDRAPLAQSRAACHRRHGEWRACGPL